MSDTTTDAEALQEVRELLWKFMRVNDWKDDPAYEFIRDMGFLLNYHIDVRSGIDGVDG